MTPPSKDLQDDEYKKSLTTLSDFLAEEVIPCIVDVVLQGTPIKKAKGKAHWRSQNKVATIWDHDVESALAKLIAKLKNELKWEVDQIDWKFPPETVHRYPKATTVLELVSRRLSAAKRAAKDAATSRVEPRDNPLNFLSAKEIVAIFKLHWNEQEDTIGAEAAGISLASVAASQGNHSSKFPPASNTPVEGSVTIFPDPSFALSCRVPEDGQSSNHTDGANSSLKTKLNCFVDEMVDSLWAAAVYPTSPPTTVLKDQHFPWRLDTSRVNSRDRWYDAVASSCFEELRKALDDEDNDPESASFKNSSGISTAFLTELMKEVRSKYKRETDQESPLSVEEMVKLFEISGRSTDMSMSSRDLASLAKTPAATGGHDQ